jgi:hypothetical protein
MQEVAGTLRIEITPQSFRAGTSYVDHITVRTERSIPQIGRPCPLQKVEVRAVQADFLAI